jgi:hypothetical protein
MRTFLVLVMTVMLAGCAKETPPGYVCGPRSAYSFPPSKGAELPTYTPWFVHLAVDAERTTGEGKKVAFAAGNPCFLAPGSMLTVIGTDKEYVIVAVDRGDEHEAEEMICPNAPLILDVRQYAMMASEAERAMKDREHDPYQERVARAKKLLGNARPTTGP